MFSKRSAGPFFSSTRRAMAPISRSQSTSAVIRRSSPSLSRRPSHSRRSMKGMVLSLRGVAYPRGRALRDQHRDEASDTEEVADRARKDQEEGAENQHATLPRARGRAEIPDESGPQHHDPQRGG